MALRGFAAEEIIHHDVTGVLVDEDNSSQLVSALVRLLNDSEFAHRLGAAGYERWEQQFSYAIFRERLRSHLKILLEK